MLGHLERHAVLKPDDVGLWNAFGFAVDGDGVVPGHRRVDGVLDNSWDLEGCKEQRRIVSKTFPPSHKISL